jgi:hypothetical protein
MPQTSVCRIDTPITQPITRHCSTVPAANACFAVGAACTQNSDCCFGNPCVANLCTKPPPLPTFNPANFTRQYASECGTGTLPVWRFFDWQATTPADSYIEIWAETSDDPSTFRSLPPAPDAVAITGVVKVFTISGASMMGWTGRDVGAAFTAANVAQHKFLQITARLVPTSNHADTPIFSAWRQAYSCPPQE